MSLSIVTTRFTVLATTMLACIHVAGCSGCEDEASEQPVRIVASGGTHGWIVPCGCSSNQSGGLPRRGSFLRQYEGKEQLVYVDTGGAPRGRSKYARAKFEAILEGEKKMGIVAHNVGAEELALGVNYLQKTAQKLGAPLLASNLYLNQKQPFESILHIERGGLRITMLGLLDDSYETITDDPVELVPPEETLRTRLADGRLRTDTDLLVVLAYMPDDKLRTLAEQFPEVDLFLGGPDHPVRESVSAPGSPFGTTTPLEGQPIPPTRLGPTMLLSATNKGKFLAVIEPITGRSNAKPGPRITGAVVVELNDRFADDPVQLEVLNAYYDRLEKADMIAADAGQLVHRLAGVPDGAKVTGSKSCQSCHEEEYKTWCKSTHATAWRSLEKTRAWVDPSCQSCHTTGYGLTNGFRSARTTPHQANVGCESCHGPSAVHVAKSELPTPLKGRSKNSCQGCHDHENSPHFDYDTYWSKIKH